MSDYQGNVPMSADILTKMQLDKPLATYTKTTIGKVGVIVLNPMTMRPEEKILAGDPRDPKAEKDSQLVKIFDEQSHMFFKNMNKKLIENGMIAPYMKEQDTAIQMLNSITDEEIDNILEEKYFTLKNRLDDFTSPVPVERILVRAIELNKGIKTIENIKARLSKLQVDEGLEVMDEKLKKHYTSLEA